MRFTLIFILLFCFFSVQATISTVNVSTGVNSSQLGRQLTVTNSASSGLVQGQRVPVVSGRTNKFVMKGDFLEQASKVEICNGTNTTVLRTISGTALVKSTASLTFSLSASDVATVGANLVLRVRYPIELNGYDRLQVRVIRVGQIDRISWAGTNIPIQLDQGTRGELSVLRPNLPYTLVLSGSNLHSGVSMNDGQNLLFGKTAIPVSASNITVNSAGTEIRVTFTPTGEVGQFETNLDSYGYSTSICFSTITSGNILGGWGKYTYHYWFTNTPLATSLNLTDLGMLAVTNNLAPKLGNIEVSGLFRSSVTEGTFLSTESLNWFTNLCSRTSSNTVTTVTIPDLRIQIKNSGYSACTNVNVRLIDKSGAVVLSGVINNVPALSTGFVTLRRPESRVSTLGLRPTTTSTTTSTTSTSTSGGTSITFLPPPNFTATKISQNTSCVRCTDLQSGGIPRWTDEGLLLEVVIPAGCAAPGVTSPVRIQL